MTQADFDYADLLTFEEVAAAARLAATMPPPYAQFDDDDVTEAAVELGLRSLLARAWVTVDVERTGVALVDGLADVVRALGAGDRFVVLARAGSGTGDRRGRIVMLDQKRAVIEEVVYPGLVSLTTIDVERMGDFVAAVFELDPLEGGAAVPAAANRVVARIPDGDVPAGAPGWQEPVLNAVLVVGHDHATGVQWVEEGGDARQLWLLELAEGTDVAAGVPAVRASSTEVRDRLAAAFVHLA